MADLSCLVIDDLDAALAAMTEVGKSVAAESASLIRESVLRYAKRRGWTVISHGSFTQWATALIKSDERRWVVLDPLFPTDGIAERALRLPLRRASVAGQFEVSGDLDIMDQLGVRTTIGLLDDAAASGGTLRHVIRMARMRGLTVSKVVVCASTRYARDALRPAIPSVPWVDYMPGDWRIVHLRDGCPHLPFTGGSLDLSASEAAKHTRQYACSPTYCVRGSVWQALHLDREIQETIGRARARIVIEMASVLGHPPTVSDVRLLGPGCRAIVAPGQIARPETPLENLLSTGR